MDPEHRPPVEIPRRDAPPVEIPRREAPPPKDHRWLTAPVAVVATAVTVIVVASIMLVPDILRYTNGPASGPARPDRQENAKLPPPPDIKGVAVAPLEQLAGEDADCTEHDRLLEGEVLSLTCTGSHGFDVAVYTYFLGGDEKTYDGFEAIVEEAGFDLDGPAIQTDAADCSDGQPAAGRWDDTDGGRFACFIDPSGNARVVFTRHDLMVAEGIVRDGSIASADQAWAEAVHRLDFDLPS
jgi:hypothetical protein